jgi:hypothetical protein
MNQTTVSWSPARSGSGPHAWRVALLAVACGLAVGALTYLGQRHLHGSLNALVNSASAWLVMPFLIGSGLRGWLSAAVAGLATCTLQLVGYYGLAGLQGYSGGSVLFFWTACAAVGGPLFGAAGSAWRGTRPALAGLGAMTLPAAFLSEGLWTYSHVLHETGTTVLWLGIGAGLAVLLSWRRPVDLGWLPLTVAVGLLGQMALTGTAAHLL